MRLHTLKRNLLKGSIITLSGLLLVPAFAQEMTTEAVTDAIYVVQGNGGNVGVFVGDDGTFMIDDKFAPMSQGIITAIKSIGGEVPKYLLNTHFHGDHSGGNESFGHRGATIVAHHNVHKRLAEGSVIAAFGMETPPAPDAALPVITFDSDIAFHINGERVRAFHVSHAHTDGDAVIHFEGSNVIHAGDIFFNGFFPFIDAANGGSVQGVIDATNQILAISDANTKIIPGHGPVASKDHLIAYRDMLVTAEARLSSLKAEGKTAKQAAAETPLSDLEAQWGNGIFTSEKWIKVIYPGI